MSAQGRTWDRPAEPSNPVSEPIRETPDERFSRILREYGPALSRLAFGYERVQGVREELMQEISLAIWQALPHFRGECSERTFVYRIGHNRGLTHACRRRPEHEPLDDLPQRLEPVDRKPHPDAEIAKTQERDRLRMAIHGLPLAYRQVVMLMLEELSQAEIAEVLGLTESNVAVRLNRARKALKDALGARA
ncbi:MAG: RNA polymerase sigma factor [Candidatus Acidiferrales bacterium]